MEENIIITNVLSLRKKHKNEVPSYEYYKQEITGRTFPFSVAAFYEIPPHKSNYPFHFHSSNTEVFYIISGEGVLKTPEGDKPIKAGDVIVCPPGENGAHKITNTSDTSLVLLDVDSNNRPDTVIYPTSNKVGYFAKQGEKGVFTINGEEVSYYKGEEN